MFWNKSNLEVQIKEYIDWKKKESPMAADIDREWLVKFLRFSNRNTVEEITLNDVLRFREKIWVEGSKYSMLDSTRAIRCFLRYFKARKYPCLSPLAIEKVKY